MIIKVTKSDIKNGKSKYTDVNPIMLAANRAFEIDYKKAKDLYEVCLFERNQILLPDKLHFRHIPYIVPKIVSDWMYDYDTGKMVEPFQFSI